MPKVIMIMPNKPKVEMDLKDADKVSIAEAMAGVKKATDKLLDDDPQLKAKVNADPSKGLLNFSNPNKPYCENNCLTPGQSNQTVKTLLIKKTKVIANIEKLNILINIGKLFFVIIKRKNFFNKTQ